MKQFLLLPEASVDLQKALLNRMLLLAVVVVTVLVFVPMALAPQDSIGLSTWLTLAISALLLVAVYFFGLRRMKNVRSSYKLTITEETITREISNMPSITILVKEIKEISRNADGSFTIKADSLLNAIGIPARIERYEELELLLSGIMPLKVETKVSLFIRYQFLIIAAVLILLYGSYMIENKYAATVVGIVFIGVMCFSWIVQQRSKNVSKRIKLFSYLMIIPVISVIMRLITLWTA